MELDPSVAGAWLCYLDSLRDPSESFARGDVLRHVRCISCERLEPCPCRWQHER